MCAMVDFDWQGQKYLKQEAGLGATKYDSADHSSSKTTSYIRAQHSQRAHLRIN